MLAEELSTCGIDCKREHLISVDSPASDHIAYTPLNALELVLRLISQPTSRVFVGAPLCREPGWNKAATGYAAMVHTTIEVLREYPRFTHRFVAPFLSCIKQLNLHLKAADHFLQPLIRKSIENVSHDGESINLVQWMLESAQGTDRNPKVLVRKLLLVNMAAIHTTSATLWHILMDLCAMPEYIEILRQEIATATAQGALTVSVLNSMEKTDSFMKESQRMNQVGLRKS